VLSGQAYTFGKKARLAVSLAWVGGFVDAVGFLELATFTSNQTGNTAMLGQHLAQGDWSAAGYIYFLVTMFLLGAMLAGVLIESARRRHLQLQRDRAGHLHIHARSPTGVYTLALAIEAILLSLTVVYHASGGQNIFLRGMLPCLAMGLQNATITRISGSVVRTTHVTGIITDLGLETVQFLYWVADKARFRRLSALGVSRVARATQRHPTFQRLLLLGGIWTVFLAGAALGVLLWQRTGILSLLFPTAFLLLMIVLERLTPLATLDAIDHAARDKAFKLYGIEPDLIPESVGIYRLGGPDTSRSRRQIRTPDLGDLHHQLKPAERIAILMVEPDIALDENALAGLERSIDELRRTNRQLLICAGNTEQFLLLSRSPVGQRLGVANLCSDPEFAVARALDCVSSPRTTREQSLG
jgi:uncharacterized membrane protein YoaK (UPF0700 family)